MPGRHLNLWKSLCLSAVVVAAYAMPAAAQVTEFTVPTPGGNPFAGITTGPDGNLWFAEFDGNKIGRITTTGTFAEFPLPNAGSNPNDIVTGPDGNLWFTEQSGNRIGRITTSGSIVEFSIPTADSQPFVITLGSDGNLWFTEFTGGKIGRITPTGVITEFSLLTTNAGPVSIVSGPDNALWFTESVANKIGRITTAGAITEFPLPAGGTPLGLTSAPDGNLWFAESDGNKIGRITTTGTITEFTVPTPDSAPADIVAGPDGNQWFTEFDGNKIGRISTSGSFIEYTGLSAGATPTGITVGPDRTLWFNEFGTNKIGRVNTFTLAVALSGTGVGLVASNPSGITCSAISSSCSNIFIVNDPVTLTASAIAGSTFTGWSGGGCSGTAPCTVTASVDTVVTATFTANPAAMLTVTKTGNGSGSVTSNPSGVDCGGTCTASFAQGTPVTLTAAAASGSTFAGWSGSGCSGISTCTVALAADTTVTASFVQNSTTNIALLSSVLPISRSAQAGLTPPVTVTAFATIINTGPGTATTCSIMPATMVPATFLFQTTDPKTNALTGTANTPVDIPQGGSQSFVIAFTPTAAFPPTDVALNFACANANPAPRVAGLNTILLSASTTPVPDVVALAVSPVPGYVEIPGNTGTGVFAVATVNLGAGGSITVTGDTGTANVPVNIMVCQTTSTGACMSPPTTNVVATIANNATPTFGFFVTGGANVADQPAVNRVFARFTDAGGAVRGATSVAVRTR